MLMFCSWLAACSEEGLEHRSASLGQMERRHETGQLVEDRLFRYGERGGAGAPVERLRLKRFPSDGGGCH